MSEPVVRNAHLDAPTFRAAVERTAHDFNFRPVLVEKDYFCSILLSPECFYRCGPRAPFPPASDRSDGSAFGKSKGRPHKT
jgi:hypothetical protein